MSMSMKAKLLTIVGALIVIGAVTGGALYYAFPVQVSTLAGLTRSYLSYFLVRTSWHDNDGIERGLQSGAYCVDGPTGPGSRILVNLSGKRPNLHRRRLACPLNWHSFEGRLLPDSEKLLVSKQRRRK
jgi:hypothetical protein